MSGRRDGTGDAIRTGVMVLGGLVGLAAAAGVGIAAFAASGGGSRSRRRNRGEEGDGRVTPELNPENVMLDDWDKVEIPRGERRRGAGGAGEAKGVGAAALVAAARDRGSVLEERRRRWRASSSTGVRGLEWDTLAREYRELAARVDALEAGGEGPEGWEAQSPAVAEDIAVLHRDVPRSFPEERRFSEVGFRKSLFRVLAVNALVVPEVGYVQGMNFLAGFLLLVHGGNEEPTYVLLARLMRDPKYDLKRLYASNLAHAGREGRVILSALAVSDPAASRLASDAGLLPEFFLEWYLTLFTVLLPRHLLEPAWDMIFEEGWPGVVRLSVALLSHALSYSHLIPSPEMDLRDGILALVKGYQCARTSEAGGMSTYPLAELSLGHTPVRLEPPSDLLERASAVRVTFEDVHHWRSEEREREEAEPDGWDFIGHGEGLEATHFDMSGLASDVFFALMGGSAGSGEESSPSPAARSPSAVPPASVEE